MSSERRGPIKNGQPFTFAAPNATAVNNTSNPVFNLRLSMGTRLLEFDVKSSNGTVLGSLPNFPRQFLSRSAAGPRQASWQGELADGNFVLAGVYSIRVRALKIFGNPRMEADYNVVESPKFRVRYTEGVSPRS